jgi:hypothetical protein
MKILKAIVLLFALFSVFSGCDRVSEVNQCSLSYGNGTLFPSANDTVRPTLNPNVPGLFVSEPDGLSLDPQQGFVLVNSSAASYRYLVRFTSLDNTQICETEILISGIRYPIGIVNLDDDDDDDDDELEPIYNSDANLPVPPGNFSPGTNPQGAVVLPNVDPATGIVDLGAANLNQLFGQPGVIPPGTQSPVTIPYSLNDASNGAARSVTVNFIYYPTEASIPQSVRDLIQQQQAQIRGGRLSAVQGHRPPVIVVVESL